MGVKIVRDDFRSPLKIRNLAFFFKICCSNFFTHFCSILELLLCHKIYGRQWIMTKTHHLFPWLCLLDHFPRLCLEFVLCPLDQFFDVYDYRPCSTGGAYKDGPEIWVARPLFFLFCRPSYFSPKNFSTSSFAQKILAYIDTKFLQKRLLSYYTHKVQLQNKIDLKINKNRKPQKTLVRSKNHQESVARHVLARPLLQNKRFLARPCISPPLYSELCLRRFPWVCLLDHF